MTAEQRAQLREVAINKMAMRQKARSASAGAWIKESGDGWEAVSSSDDQANGGFIIAHFEGPDAAANREFMQAATPDAVLALLDELERKDALIAEQDKRTVTLPPCVDDLHGIGMVMSADAVAAALTAAGINLTVEG